jgi:hypothetical protein
MWRGWKWIGVCLLSADYIACVPPYRPPSVHPCLTSAAISVLGGWVAVVGVVDVGAGAVEAVVDVGTVGAATCM